MIDHPIAPAKVKGKPEEKKMAAMQSKTRMICVLKLRQLRNSMKLACWHVLHELHITLFNSIKMIEF